MPTDRHEPLAERAAHATHGFQPSALERPPRVRVKPAGGPLALLAEPRERRRWREEHPHDHSRYL